MKFFSSRKTFTVEIIDLPRQSWRVLPPPKLAIALTMAVIIVTAVVWAIVG